MTLIFRKARASDLAVIVGLLRDDDIGRDREDAAQDMAAYHSAFAEIDADPNQFLCVVMQDEQIVGTLQLTMIPGLSRRGAKRGQIEAVRVARDHRGEGIGCEMFDWAIAQCKAQGCALIQLTTDKARADAHRFYDSLGLQASHTGYKLQLNVAQ